MELKEVTKSYLVETAESLRGAERRLFMARTVRWLGAGGQRQAERELGWNRVTIAKGTHELSSGSRCLDNFCGRGRHKAEDLLPNLLHDIAAIVDGQSQTDPSFQTQRLYTRLTPEVVRQQLLLTKGYTDLELPSSKTIRRKMRLLGYRPTRVAKCQPKKKIKETDAIFERLAEVNSRADEDDTKLRLSLDAKATVKIGLFCRGGRSWLEVKALDHDFKPDATLTPFGILLPRYKELSLYFVRSTLTSDFIADMLGLWWENARGRFPQVKTLLINQDNGPENSSRRTQYVNRLVAFARGYGLRLELAYYPPYHSKYKPIERCWGALEQHWNGQLLDTIPAALRLAQSMTWHGKHPAVQLIDKTYCKGVRLDKHEMALLEHHLERLPGLAKWFLSIPPRTPLPLV